MKNGIAYRDNQRIPAKTKVYCVETKTLLGVFDTRGEAARFAGIKPNLVFACVKTKSRCHKNKLNKILAFR